MKRRSVELERREWLTEGDAQRVVVAALTWCPTDRVNGYPSIDADAPSACVP